jgi:hypothetical protein
MDAVLLFCVIGLLAIALGVDLAAAVGWLRQQYHRRIR